MNASSLPSDPSGLIHLLWEQVEPHYHDLEARAVTAATADEFLRDWTRVAACVDEAQRRLRVETTRNTADEDVERRFHTFLEEVFPRAQSAEQRLKERLLAGGLEPAGFSVPLQKMRADAAVFSPANLPLLAEEQKLAIEYNKRIGAQTVQWDGRELTLPQLRPVYQSGDRAVRERAWRLAADRELADREAINDLWGRFLTLRRRLAANAGFEDYRAFRWRQLHRFDYTPEDCAAFHQAIEGVVLPAARRVYERRRRQLGVDRLRPWDLDVNPRGRPPLAPFQDVAHLEVTTGEMFRRLDGELGGYFDTMRAEGLLDLENRKHKAPGGYCASFAVAGRPFIFMNAVGVHDDVQTLLHEAGHAFHVFERSRLPYIHQRAVGAEFSEVASMAMELLAAPHLARHDGGFYDEADAARALVEHLESSILFWPYMAVVDAFQHWVYAHPEAAADPGACDAHWDALWGRFMGGVDWSGLDRERMTGWQRKTHIHTIPFYYVEYGLAQLGAVQIWAGALRDQEAAVRRYRVALSRGGTLPLPALYAEAGATFAFDAGTLAEGVRLMEQQIAALGETFG